MRVALVEVLGSIIHELAEAPQDESDGSQKAKNLKQINGLYDLLLERMLDVSSYVRVKVLATLSKLCEGGSKFPQQRLAMTRAAVEALEDKTSSVRKAAVSLLVKLILTHPYGMYGGYLSEEEWKVKYKEVADMLEKMEGDLGKAVEHNDREGSQEEDGEEDGDGEEGAGGQQRKKKRKPWVIRWHQKSVSFLTYSTGRPRTMTPWRSMAKRRRRRRGRIRSRGVSR